VPLLLLRIQTEYGGFLDALLGSYLWCLGGGVGWHVTRGAPGGMTKKRVLSLPRPCFSQFRFPFPAQARRAFIKSSVSTSTRSWKKLHMLKSHRCGSDRSSYDNIRHVGHRCFLLQLVGQNVLKMCSHLLLIKNILL
jgi:hypothetical protein